MADRPIMSGQGRGGQKPSQRLGSLAADKDTEKAGRLGELRSLLCFLSRSYVRLMFKLVTVIASRRRRAAHECRWRRQQHWQRRRVCWHGPGQRRIRQRACKACKGVLEHMPTRLAGMQRPRCQSPGHLTVDRRWLSATCTAGQVCAKGAGFQEEEGAAVSIRRGRAAGTRGSDWRR